MGLEGKKNKFSCRNFFYNDRCGYSTEVLNSVLEVHMHATENDLFLNNLFQIRYNITQFTLMDLG